MEYVDYIKSRIGEPIVSIKIEKNNLYFGSISGYIGKSNLETKELIYCQKSFDELIRDILIY